MSNTQILCSFTEFQNAHQSTYRKQREDRSEMCCYTEKKNLPQKLTIKSHIAELAELKGIYIYNRTQMKRWQTSLDAYISAAQIKLLTSIFRPHKSNYLLVAWRNHLHNIWCFCDFKFSHKKRVDGHRQKSSSICKHIL